MSTREDPVRVIEMEPVEMQTMVRGVARIKVPAPAEMETSLKGL